MTDRPNSDNGLKSDYLSKVANVVLYDPLCHCKGVTHMIGCVITNSEAKYIRTELYNLLPGF